MVAIKIFNRFRLDQLSNLKNSFSNGESPPVPQKHYKNQFGFKEKTSCNHAVFTENETECKKYGNKCKIF